MLEHLGRRARRLCAVRPPPFPSAFPCKCLASVQRHEPCRHRRRRRHRRCLHHLSIRSDGVGCAHKRCPLQAHAPARAPPPPPCAGTEKCEDMEKQYKRHPPMTQETAFDGFRYQASGVFHLSRTNSGCFHPTVERLGAGAVGCGAPARRDAKRTLAGLPADPVLPPAARSPPPSTDGGGRKFGGRSPAAHAVLGVVDHAGVAGAGVVPLQAAGGWYCQLMCTADTRVPARPGCRQLVCMRGCVHDEG